MRIAIGGIEHETNTYADATAGRTSADDFDCSRGQAILDDFTDTGTPMGGMIDGAHQLGAEIAPTLRCFAQPSGTILADGYAALRSEVCDRLHDAMPLDIVALSLHGAGVVEGIDDLEGDLAQAVRDVIGPDVTLVATFDLHGNVTQQMADTLDAGFGFHLYPHTDMRERG